MPEREEKDIPSIKNSARTRHGVKGQGFPIFSLTQHSWKVGSVHQNGAEDTAEDELRLHAPMVRSRHSGEAAAEATAEMSVLRGLCWGNEAGKKHVKLPRA